MFSFNLQHFVLYLIVLKGFINKEDDDDEADCNNKPLWQEIKPFYRHLTQLKI